MHALVDRASGVDVLFHAPWGLAPPGAPPREGSDGHAFLETYAGGWQELFPSADEPCTYRGHDIGYHGEVAAIPWQVRADGPLSLVCTIDCRTAPFRLERRLTLVADAPQLRVDERVSNTGHEDWECTWGHHLVLGPPFVAAGRAVRARGRARSSRSRRCTRTRRASSRVSAAPGPTRSCAPAAPSTCARCPGPRRTATTTCS